MGIHDDDSPLMLLLGIKVGGSCRSLSTSHCLLLWRVWVGASCRFCFILCLMLLIDAILSFMMLLFIDASCAYFYCYYSLFVWHAALKRLFFFFSWYVACCCWCERHGNLLMWIHIFPCRYHILSFFFLC